MQRSLRILALLLVTSLVPGVQEVFEQAAHWIVSSHSHGAHSEAGAGHENSEREVPTEEEHGDGEASEHDCSGAMHACQCCRIPGDSTVATFIGAAPQTTSVAVETTSLLAGVHPALLRPPAV